MTAPAPVAFEPVDEPQLATLVAWIRAYYAFDDIAFDPPTITRAARELVQEPALGGAWLIVARAQVVGYFVLTFGFDLEFGGRQATVTELYLAPEGRGHGYGAAAIRFAEEVTRARGGHALELQVERDNARARAFYTRLGLRPHDRIPMSKLLGAP